MALNFKKAMGSRWVMMMGVGGLLMGAPACAPEAEGTPAPATAESKQSIKAPIGQTIWFKSCLTGKFVSADGNLGGNSPLVADRAATAGWEHFQVIDAGNGTIALRVSETGKYVSADTNLGGRLVADRTSIGDWERFTWVEFADGNIGLLAKSTGKYVAADTNRGGNAPLFADRTTTGCWEAFSIGVVGGGGGGGGWKQIWNDEFDGTSVNTSNWSYITDVHVNNEQQQYTTSGNNVQVSNGTLKLIARRENNNGYPFTSGRLETAGKRQFTHGAVEARLKMPVGAGLWPAFWMLGHDIGSVGWPNCGELDIMENVGYGDWVSMALHGPGYSGNTPVNGRYTFPSGQSVAGWHNYRVEYSPNDIKWFVDGNLYRTVTKAEVTRYGAWQYDKPQYIILNLAVGGGYPAGVNGATTPFYGVPQSTADLISRTPQVFEIDWVRVYQWQ